MPGFLLDADKCTYNISMRKYIVHWAVAIIAEQDGKELVHLGHTHDISLAEATVFVDEMLNTAKPVTLEVRIPKGKSIKEWVVVEIQCGNAVSIAEEDHFRIPLQFKSFSGDGKQVLEDALKERGGPMEASQ